MTENQSPLLRIGEHLDSARKNRVKLLLFNAAVLLLALLAIFFFPRKYLSEAKIWIKLGRENSRLDPTASTGKTISIQENDREDEIKSVIDILGSRGVVTATVEQLSPAVVLGDEPLPDAEEGSSRGSNPVTEFAKGMFGSVVGLVKLIDPVSEKEEAIQEILDSLSVEAERKSNVVSVSYEAETPALAQAIVQGLVDAYKEKHNRIHATEGSRSFFGEQRQVLEDRVSDASEELRAAKDRIGIASIGGQQAILEDQLSHVQRIKLDTVQQLTESKARINQLNLLMEEHPLKIASEERSVPNTGRDMIRSRLYDLQVQRMELEAKMTNHPKLKIIKQQEQEAREELAQQTTTERKEKTESLNQIHQMLLSDLAKVQTAEAGLEAKLNSLNAQESAILERITQLNEADIEVRKLERALQLAINNHMTYEENFEDARVDEALNQSTISNIGLAQPPTFQEKPVSPSKVLFGLIALMIMFMGSAGIIVGLPALQATASASPGETSNDAIGQTPQNIGPAVASRQYSEAVN